MKNIFFVLLLLTVSGYAVSQVTLQPVLPASGMVQKAQLWNVVVVNSSVDNYKCRLTITLRDRVTNLEVLSASSSIFSIATGAKQLDINFLNPVQYNYAASGQETKLQGLIPVGNYIACYSLTANGDKATDIADECVPFDVEPLSPPQLILPADSSVLEASPTIFSWIPPSPDGIFSGLNYEILITPVNEGQKAEEAIQQNLPVFSQASLISNYLNYSKAYSSLEKNQWYAWQVIAKDKGSYAGKTEVWTFKVGEKRPDKINAGIPFVKLSNQSSRVAMAENGIVKIAFDNDANQKKIQLQLYNLNSNKKNQSASLMVKLTPGENFIQYDLRKAFTLKEGGIYMIKTADANGQSLSGTFIVKNIKK